MIVDENGKKWPETVEEEAKMQHTREMMDRFFERKARREGWAKPELNQGKPEAEKTKLDRMFEKRHPEWYRQEPVKQEKKRPSLPLGFYQKLKEMDKED